MHEQGSIALKTTFKQWEDVPIETGKPRAFCCSLHSVAEPYAAHQQIEEVQILSAWRNAAAPEQLQRDPAPPSQPPKSPEDARSIGIILFSRNYSEVEHRIM